MPQSSFERYSDGACRVRRTSPVREKVGECGAVKLRVAATKKNVRSVNLEFSKRCPGGVRSFQPADLVELSPAELSEAFNRPTSTRLAQISTAQR